jgi:hypothetical protein
MVLENGIYHVIPLISKQLSVQERSTDSHWTLWDQQLQVVGTDSKSLHTV